MNTLLNALSRFFLNLSHKIVPEDLNGKRVLRIHVTKQDPKKFTVLVTDVKTDAWFKYQIRFPENPLIQEDKPMETLRDFFLHTGSHDELCDSKHLSQWKKVIDEGLAEGICIRMKRAVYNIVLDFLKSQNGNAGETFVEAPPEHMFCQELAGSWLDYK